MMSQTGAMLSGPQRGIRARSRAETRRAGRIFVGLIAFIGLGKLFSFRDQDRSVPRDAGRPPGGEILDFDLSERGAGTELPLLPTLVDDPVTVS